MISKQFKEISAAFFKMLNAKKECFAPDELETIRQFGAALKAELKPEPGKYLLFESDSFKKEWARWINGCKQKGRPLTDAQMQANANYLFQYSGGDEKEAIECLRHNTAGGYTRIYPHNRLVKESFATPEKKQETKAEKGTIDVPVIISHITGQAPTAHIAAAVTEYLRYAYQKGEKLNNENQVLAHLKMWFKMYAGKNGEAIETAGVQVINAMKKAQAVGLTKPDLEMLKNPKIAPKEKREHNPPPVSSEAETLLKKAVYFIKTYSDSFELHTAIERIEAEKIENGTLVLKVPLFYKSVLEKPKVSELLETAVHKYNPDIKLKKLYE